MVNRLSFFQHIRSHESQFIQLADFFIGAVTYKSERPSLEERWQPGKKRTDQLY